MPSIDRDWLRNMLKAKFKEAMAEQKHCIDALAQQTHMGRILAYVEIIDLIDGENSDGNELVASVGTRIIEGANEVAQEKTQ